MRTALFDHRRSLRAREGAAGFTLLELIVVLAIVVVLLTLAVPVVGPAVDSTNVASAGAQIVDQFNFARQTALTRNRAVEVRFYGAKNPLTGQPPSSFTALRLLLIEEDATENPLTKIIRLPSNIIISGDHAAPDKSSLLKVSAATPVAPRFGRETAPIGGDLTDYVAFQFERDGSTDLDVNGPGGSGTAGGAPPPVSGSASWHLTVRAERTKVGANQLPANYVTIQVDPLTGRVRVFRP